MLLDSVLEDGYCNTKVSLQGAFGNSIEAKLVNVPCKLVTSEFEDSKSVILTVALTDSLVRDEALISLADYEILLKSKEDFIPKVEFLGKTRILFTDPSIGGEQNSRRLETLIVEKTKNETDVFSAEIEEPKGADEMGLNFENMVSCKEFKDLQLSDLTLKKCWKDSQEGKSEFFQDESNHLLYRFTVVSGVKLKQLVLPKCKRQKVISFAHDSLWSMHMGFHKTMQRIQAHFFGHQLLEM